jgi:septal ring factor EnvC (AmiA/AmiB activator)
LQAEYNETDKELKKLEEKWKDLKTDQERLEKLLDKAKSEAEEPNDRNPNTSTLKETLTMQLREQENTYSRLKNVSI